MSAELEAKHAQLLAKFGLNNGASSSSDSKQNSPRSDSESATTDEDSLTPRSEMEAFLAELESIAPEASKVAKEAIAKGKGLIIEEDPLFKAQRLAMEDHLKKLGEDCDRMAALYSRPKK